jgi:ribosome maturation protein Sdo1
MAPVLQFDKNPKEKKSSFLVMTQDEKELDDDVVKEIECLCPMLFKGVTSVVKVETTIPGKVPKSLADFRDLIAYEPTNDLRWRRLMYEGLFSILLF